jgi:hypothetical protein
MAVFVTRSGSFSFRAQFADNSWEDIILACRMKQVPETWIEGDSKPMTINGLEYQIDIIGRNHDSYANGTGLAPLTFQFSELYETEYPMMSTYTNKGGWGSSKMRSTHLPAILAKMPAFVQAAIQPVNKLTSAGNKSGTIQTTADKLFLLSEVEVFGSVENAAEGEGRQYTYHLDSYRRKAMINGSYNGWFLRSPRVYDAVLFCYVDDDGYYSTTGGDTPWGVAPAWCF